MSNPWTTKHPNSLKLKAYLLFQACWTIQLLVFQRIVDIMIIFIPFHLPDTLLEQLGLLGLRQLGIQVEEKNLTYNNSNLLSSTLC